MPDPGLRRAGRPAGDHPGKPALSTPDPRLVELIGGWIERGRPDGRPPLIAVSGCQGSGKTTLARAAAQAFGAARLSLDDVYLTRAERTAAAERVHPLFAVRGPPGTHDLDLARRTVEALRSAEPGVRTPIPSFDKLADNRLPEPDWPVFEGRPSAVIVDGWCLGATPIPAAALKTPASRFEAEEDPHGAWRRAWNAELAGPYAGWFADFDAVLFLAAPSWDVVPDWRCEQEADLLGIAPEALPPERREALARFVAVFRRLTEHMLAGGLRADALARLDERRRVLDIRCPPASAAR